MKVEEKVFIESFVRNLIKKSDLSVLTKRMVRDEYQQHCRKESLTKEEKMALNDIVYRLLDSVSLEGNSKHAECEDKENPPSPTKRATSPRKKSSLSDTSNKSTREKCQDLKPPIKADRDNDGTQAENSSPEGLKKTKKSAPQTSPRVKIEEVVEAILESDSEVDDDDDDGLEDSSDENEETPIKSKSKKRKCISLSSDSESENLEPFPDETPSSPSTKSEKSKKHLLHDSDSDFETTGTKYCINKFATSPLNHGKCSKSKKRKLISDESGSDEISYDDDIKRKKKKRITVSVFSDDNDDDFINDSKSRTSNHSDSDFESKGRDKLKVKKSVGKSRTFPAKKSPSTKFKKSLSTKSESTKLKKSPASKSKKSPVAKSKNSPAAISPCQVKATIKKNKQKKVKVFSVTETSDSSDEESLSLADYRRRNSSSSQSHEISQSGLEGGARSEGEEQEDIVTKEKKEKSKYKVVDSSSEEGSDTSENLSTNKKTTKKSRKNENSKQNRKGQQKEKSKASQMSSRYKDLWKMCREVGVFIGSLADYSTEKEKIQRLTDLLHKAGMKGEPTFKQAERIRLKKEAAELDQDNIMENSGRGRRRVRSLYSSHVPSPQKPVTPVRQKLCNLKDIIDSEESSED